MRINCVVVTYNREKLLKENITSLKAQTYHINKIFIINNHSTDDTANFLSQFSNDPQIQVCNLEKNVGGAGGFSYGIRLAVEDGCDYVWIMDDDTIPQSDTLERLAEATAIDDNIGFLCSKVVWTDGNLHKMNKCGILQPQHKTSLQSDPETYGFACNNCTFVSALFKSDAIYKVGLPYKEFFIWHDDIEYTSRIINAGFKGYYIDKSVAVHKTEKNYAPRVYDVGEKDLWKFYYQARNTTFMARMLKPNKLFFYISALNKYRVYIRRINKINNKEIRKALKKEVKRGCIDGLRFNPKIDYVQRH